MCGDYTTFGGVIGKSVGALWAWDELVDHCDTRRTTWITTAPLNILPTYRCTPTILLLGIQGNLTLSRTLARLLRDRNRKRPRDNN